MANWARKNSEIVRRAKNYLHYKHIKLFAICYCVFFLNTNYYYMTAMLGRPYIPELYKHDTELVLRVEWGKRPC